MENASFPIRSSVTVLWSQLQTEIAREVSGWNGNIIIFVLPFLKTMLETSSKIKFFEETSGMGSNINIEVVLVFKNNVGEAVTRYIYYVY